jgi:undecaprenyl diphosphate synthase
MQLATREAPVAEGQIVAPRHIGIIMDGNGRWAAQRGLPRLAGHRAGVENIRPILRECAALGIEVVTLYAFSTENWRRPPAEVDGLLCLMDEFVDREGRALHDEGVRVVHLGTFDGVPGQLRRKVEWLLDLTRTNTRITAAVAFNYGGRAELVAAVRSLVATGLPAEEIEEQTLADRLFTRGLPDPDLIIRTSGERRISNFLIWQAAYSEYWTTPVLWPEFGSECLREAIRAYGDRARRFGGVAETPR